MESETSYTPGSVVPTARMAIHLDLALPSGSSSLPEGFGRAVLERLLLGLAPDEACHAANCHQRPGGLLHRRFTLTHRPKPVRRSILCCAISQVALGGRYPPSCSMEPGSSSTDGSVAAIKRSQTHYDSKKTDERKIKKTFFSCINFSVKSQCCGYNDDYRTAKQLFGPYIAGNTA